MSHEMSRCLVGFYYRMLGSRFSDINFFVYSLTLNYQDAVKSFTLSLRKQTRRSSVCHHITKLTVYSPSQLVPAANKTSSQGAFLWVRYICRLGIYAKRNSMTKNCSVIS